jgi:hypothetical protein
MSLNPVFPFTFLLSNFQCSLLYFPFKILLSLTSFVIALAIVLKLFLFIYILSLPFLFFFYFIPGQNNLVLEMNGSPFICRNYCTMQSYVPPTDVFW